MLKKRAVLAAGATVGMLVLAMLLVAFLGGKEPSQPTATVYQSLLEHQQVRADIRAEASPPSVLDSAVARATPAPALHAAPVARIRIERIDVDAEVVPLNLTPAGAMDTPQSPELVAWYDFTGKPGLGGNAVFSGHVDWRNYGPAVFWGLKDLQPGDLVEVVLTDGTVLRYSVTAAWSYALEELEMREVLAQTAVESLTLITCSGQFAEGEYTHRLVVRAVHTEAAEASE